MKNTWIGLLSFCLILAMVLSMLPASALASQIGKIQGPVLRKESTNILDAESRISSEFVGKTVSILGDSISTFAGVSNNTSYNTTIGSNAVYYSDSGSLGRADTWWQQTIDVLGMELLVNNSWSGSCVLHTRSNTVGAYVDRCVQLHNNQDEEPDIIVVFMGTNDFSYYQSTLGTADIDYDALITDKSDGTFTYATPTTTCEAYAIMLHKMTVRYPDAEIYCMTMTARRDPIYSGSDVGQPTAFNAELAQIIAHFGATVVDLENCGITKDPENFDLYMGDKRVHPNKAGMDKITQVLLSTMLGREMALYNVSGTYTGVDTDNAAAAAASGLGYTAKLTLVAGYSDLKVTVTMGGVDITETAYTDGVIRIETVTGDIVITATAKRAPLNFRWEYENGELVSVGSTENALTKLAGSTTDGVFIDTRYQLQITVLLQHDRPWVLEWKGSGTGGFMLSEASGASSAPFFFRRAGNYLNAFGDHDGSRYNNYGVALDTTDIDGSALHVYRLENRIAADGTNMVYLYVDGVEIGALNNHYVGGTAQGATGNWISGKDFKINYIGTPSHPLTNYSMEYLLVNEGGHSYTSVVTAPTCTDKGYTTHTCVSCGASYTSDHVDALGHKYSGNSCTRCGGIDPETAACPENPLAALWPLLNTDLTHIICYGQSFSNGSDAPIYPDPAVDGVYVFGNIANSTNGTGLSSLATSGNQHPIISAGNVLAQLLAAAGYDTDIILGSYGSGGRSIAQLMSAARQQQIRDEEGYTYDCNSSGRYEVFASSVNAIAQYAQTNGQSVACPVIVYLQGERDFYTDAQLGYPTNAANAAYAAGGDKEKYKEYMTRLKEDMQAQVMEAYGQTEKPLFVIYQISGAYVKENSSINMAQIEFAQENEDVILIQTPYFTPHYTNSNHLTTNGYRWLGEYIARYVYTALVEREKPWPMMPENFAIEGSNVVRITVAGAQNGLNIDTYTVENATNSNNLYGFNLLVDGKNVVPQSVAVFGNDIILTLPEGTDLAAATSVYVYYAGKNAKGTGNIRDNCTDLGFYEYLDDSNDTGTGNNQGVSHSALDASGNALIGEKYPLYNWLASFCYDIKTDCLHQHSYAQRVVAPTCADQGYTAYVCTCGDSYARDLTDATGHSYTSVVAAPTCTEKGYTIHTCASCGDSYVDGFVDATGHSHTAEVTTAPTCEKPGVRTYTCHCGDAYTEPIPATGHLHTRVVNAKDATCGTDGYTGDTVCDDCGKTIATGSVIGATGNHSYTSEVTTAPGCETTGVRTYTCTTCSRSYTEEIAANGHAYTSVVTAPTCTEKGYTTHTCYCGHSYVDSETNALGHDMGAWEETKAPSCTEKGQEQRTCSRCDYVETREFAARGHGYTSVVTDPTCTEPGYTTHTCTTCGDSYVDSYTDALGHSYDDGVVTKEPTCVEDGVKTYSCTVCGGTKHETVEKTGVHTYDEGVVTTAPTCTAEGVMTYICVHCGHSYTEVIPAVSHNFVDGACVDCGAPEVELGDVNGDGKINARDARLLLRYAAGLIGEDEINLAASDYNGDGKVNARDARALLRAIAGMD